MSQFYDLLQRVRGEQRIPKTLLCLDPGETTGWSIFHEGKLIDWGQSKTVEDGNIIWNEIQMLFLHSQPSHILCEDYRIYQHKLDRHSFSPVLTLRIIGGIDLLANQTHISINYQMASQAKGFVTDDKLKLWNFWQSGQRHARDSIRHACYFLLFYNKGKDII
jgi:hypothetical protein